MQVSLKSEHNNSRRSFILSLVLLDALLKMRIGSRMFCTRQWRNGCLKPRYKPARIHKLTKDGKTLELHTSLRLVFSDSEFKDPMSTNLR